MCNPLKSISKLNFKFAICFNKQKTFRSDLEKFAQHSAAMNSLESVFILVSW